MPQGGRIAPDGRPPQAPGVGKNAKRHDLEAPATPGVRNSDMQQGDRQKLEAAQKIAPRPKKGSPQGGAQPNRNQSGGGMPVPDPIEFAGNRIGGQSFAGGSDQVVVDSSPWVPLLEKMATSPNSGGVLAANLMNVLTGYNRRPVVSRVVFLDMQELDAEIDRSI